MIKKIKMPKQAGWLLPGLQVKRWFALIFVGAVLITVGILILFDLKPIYNTMQFIQQIATQISTEWLAFGIVMIGAAIFFKGWQKTNLSILDIEDDRNNDVLLENLYKRRKLNRGPRIVAVGGGTGLSMLLSGAKNIAALSRVFAKLPYIAELKTLLTTLQQLLVLEMMVEALED